MIGSRLKHFSHSVLTRHLCRQVTSTNTSCAFVSTPCRSIFSVTSCLLEKKTFNVPTMGDSITEGTIVEWTAAVGQAVKEGDVVALIETDKVTVDIKAEVDGVIVQHFGQVDDNVEVGAKLYEIDTEAEGTMAASTEAKVEEESITSESESTSESTIEPTVVVPAAPKHTRSPSIQFLGKIGWQERLAGNEKSPAQPTSPSSPTAVITIQGVIHPMYGRPRFTEKEMEALILGGAETAPSVVKKSGGAQFAI